MAIATKTTTTLAATITQQGLYNALKTAFTAAGFGNPYDEYTSADNSLRCAWLTMLDNTKVYGTTGMRFRVGTDLSLGFLMGTGWDKTNHTTSNFSTDYVSPAFAPSQPITLDSVNGGGEFKLVIVSQGTTKFNFCYLSPANKPIWWDLNSYPYGFINGSADFSLFYGSALNPYSNINFSNSLNRANLATANVITNKRDIELGVNFYSQSNQGIMGKSSDDLVSIAAVGTSRFDIVRVAGNPSKDFLIINNAAGGLGIRVF